MLFSMPGFIGNYTLPLIGKDRVFNTLACKLVTSFKGNIKLNMPNILATIFLLDSETGKLKCLIEATEITAWRTGAASLVATKHLWFMRNSLGKNIENYNNTVLSIIGCGVQVIY